MSKATIIKQLLFKINKFYSVASLYTDDFLNHFKMTFENFIDKRISKEDFLKWVNLNNSNISELGKQFITYKDAFIFYKDDFVYVISKFDSGYVEDLLYNYPHLINDLDSNEDYSIKLLSEKVLIKTDAIPILFLYKLRMKQSNQRSIDLPISKDNVKYHVIFEVLKILLGQDVEKIQLFIDNNKATIDRVLQGIKHSRPQILGKGADGIALDIGNQQVLKIFTGHEGFIKAKRLWKELILAN